MTLRNIFMKFITISSFCDIQDAAAHNDSSDTALSDYQPPAKRKYVLKNKAPASAAYYNRGLNHFCPHLRHKLNKTSLKMEFS